MNNPIGLEGLYKENIFRISDYQRGNAWQKEQYRDFWEEQSDYNELDDKKLLELLELKYNALADTKQQLGSIASIRETFIGFLKWLYGEVG
jgi:hypothetical protein